MLRKARCHLPLASLLNSSSLNRSYGIQRGEAAQLRLRAELPRMQGCSVGGPGCDAQPSRPATRQSRQHAQYYKLVQEDLRLSRTPNPPHALERLPRLAVS